MSKLCSLLSATLIVSCAAALPARLARADHEPHYARPTAAQPPTRAAREPPTRAHRLSFGLSFALGYAALGDVKDAVVSAAKLGKATYGIPFESSTSSLALGGMLSLRYTAPFYLLAELGVGVLHSHQTLAARREVSFSSYVIEVPLLVGGHLPLGRRWSIFGAVGPAFYLHNVLVVEGTSDFDTGPKVGFQAALGADVMLLPAFSLGLEARFRLANLGGLEVTDTSIALQNDDGSGDVELDITGFTVLVTARAYIF